ncbi:MAG: hypothetical protein C4576_03295 [Desulfobacteraceae bacterium]|nr:MAG: hypothetical protein C4576_03295 [Desulfobacteraceae bacterium]
MEVRDIELSNIREGYHPRKDLKGHEELKEDIAKNGLREPITVRPHQDHFIVIDGYRRLMILRDLGWKTVPCIIEDTDERNAAHQSYLANAGALRRNLNPIEVALHIREMRDRFRYTVRELVGLGYAKDDQSIYNRTNLLTLPEEIQEKIADGQILPTLGYELAKVKDKKAQSELSDEILKRDRVTIDKFKKMKKRIIREGRKDGNAKEIEIPKCEIPGVFIKGSEDMSELPNESVGLIVTSPPYGVGLEYEEGVDFESHLKMLENVLTECVRVLSPGGKICINAGDIHNYGSARGGRPEIKMMGHHFQEILGKHHIRLVDEIIWKKCQPGKRDFNWFNNPQVSYHDGIRHGSYRMLNNTEYVLVFEKDGRREVPSEVEKESRISKDEWKKWVDSVWEIPPEKDHSGHPAPFAEELPRRLIRMYSYKGDVVLDPFLGSGTTVKVANELGRKGVGYEKDEKYKPAIMKKLEIRVEDLKKEEHIKIPQSEPEGDRVKGNLDRLNQIVEQIVSSRAAQDRKISSIQIDLSSMNPVNDAKVAVVSEEDAPGPGSPEPRPSAIPLDAGEKEGVERPLLPAVVPQCTAVAQLPLNKVVLGDCLTKLKELPDNSIDLLATDPPYGLKFMGKDWDKAVPAVDMWKEVLRAMKPGAFAFVMCAPRQDCLARMIVNLEDAGFKLDFTSLYWTYAQGFPKAHHIGRAIDKKLGATREILGKNPNSREKCDKSNTIYESGTVGKTVYITKPATEKANELEGAYGGFQPKPAVEVIIVAMKPMDEKTFVGQSLKNGKGLTWMDDCRIPYADATDKDTYDKCSSVNGIYETGLTWGGKKLLDMPKAGARTADFFGEVGEGKEQTWSASAKGRFPANLLVSDEVLDDGWERRRSKPRLKDHAGFRTKYVGGETKSPDLRSFVSGDSGGFSRFFSLDAWANKNLPFLIVPKASKKEKDAGLETCEKKIIQGRDPGQDVRNVAFKSRPTTRKNTHPTVKPTRLMAYLITMGSREGDVVLDPFCGSGTTCVAAKMLNRKFVGIEISPEYQEIATKRIEGHGKNKDTETRKRLCAEGYEVEGCSVLFNSEPKRDNSVLVNSIIRGDSFDAIKQVEDDSIDLCLTSPPYADVKDYGRSVKVLHPDEYVDWILPLLQEVHRTLTPSGSFILNINDRIVNKQRHPYVHELIFRATMETGLKLYDTYTWVKRGTTPSGNRKRVNDWTEYLIHFCKDASLLKWNMDDVREPHNPNTIKRCAYPVSGFGLKVDEEGRAAGRERKAIRLNEKGKIPSNVFTFPTAAAVKGKIHPAAFHISLPTWFIRALTDERDLVLDPFCGTGTTCLAAKQLKRKFMGFEINEHYHKCAEERVNNVALAMAA